MPIDHVSLATHDMGATRAFYEGTLGFRVVIHETLAISKGGSVDHIFFDTGEGAFLAFMKWNGVAGVSGDFDTGINRGLGVPPGTFHVALRCPSLEALESRRFDLLTKGVAAGDILPLHPYRSFLWMIQSTACDSNTRRAWPITPKMIGIPRREFFR